MFQFTHPGRGATPLFDRCRGLQMCFNSRTPGGVRRLDLHSVGGRVGVSIHAPREGCDCSQRIEQPRRGRFNSRTPGGVRLCQRACVSPFQRFQFTHPGRGATNRRYIELLVLFQFTHPGRGATSGVMDLLAKFSGFNSRTPGGVRPYL